MTSENTLILNFHEDLQSSAITMPVFQCNTIVLGIVSFNAWKRINCCSYLTWEKILRLGNNWVIVASF